jgi:hypothetical protein
MAFEMREKSGIDQVLRTEGIDRDIAEIRRLARGEIGGVVAAVRSTADAARISPASGSGEPAPSAAGDGQAPSQPVSVDHARENPAEGPDAYGALPDTATTYDVLAPSALAEEALYVRGEASEERRDGPSGGGGAQPARSSETAA